MGLSQKARKLLELLGDKITADEIADAIDGASNSNIPGEPQTTTVTLTAAQLRKLNATPVTLVAAPGAGYALVPIRTVAKLTAGSNAFDAVGDGDDLTIKYTNSSGAIVTHFETTGFLDQLTNQVRVALPGNASGALKEVTPVANAALVAHILAGEIAAADANANGNGTLSIEIQYVKVAV